MANKPTVDILFISHKHELIGGAESALINQVEYVRSKGIHAHTIVGAKGTLTQALDRIGAPYSIIGIPLWAHGPEDSSPFVFQNTIDPSKNTLKEICALIDRLKPKLCVTGTIANPWLAFAAAIKHIPHTWYLHETGEDHRLQLALGKESTYRLIDALSDKVFCNSLYVREFFQSKFVTNADIGIINPYVKAPLPNADAAPFFRNDSLKLSIVGQVKPSKGQFDAVRAIAQLRKQGIRAQLAIIGAHEDKAYVQDIQRFIEKNKLSNDVCLVGHVPNPADITHQADIVLVTSMKEAFGMVTLEGMLLGKPVIGTNTAGTAEIIKDTAVGALYEAGNVAELAAKISELAKDPHHMKRLGIAARSYAMKRFSADKCYREFMRYYATIGTLPKHSLDLTLIDSLIQDHSVYARMLQREITSLQSTVSNLLETIAVQQHSLDRIHASLAYRLYRKSKKLLPKNR